jgi:hypothetical protein
MYVIATGDAFDGIVLWGPFLEMEDAHEWAESHFDHWDCIKLKQVGAY